MPKAWLLARWAGFPIWKWMAAFNEGHNQENQSLETWRNGPYGWVSRPYLTP